MKKEKFNINEFYQWAMQTYVKENMGTHPINWITLAKFSNMFPDKSFLTGVKPIEKSMSEMLVGKKYEYVVSPSAFEKGDKIDLDSWDIKTQNAPVFNGELKFNKNNFFLTGFYNREVSIEKVWILREIKNNEK